MNETLDKKEDKKIGTNISPSRPTDGQEEDINRGRIFRLYYQKLKILYKTHIGLKNEVE